MTKRKRHGRVTDSGRFLFNKGINIFTKNTSLQKRVSVLHQLFSPKNTILDIDEFLAIYSDSEVGRDGIDCSLWLSHTDNLKYDYFSIQGDYAFRLISHNGKTRPVANIVFDFSDDWFIYTCQNQGREGEKNLLDIIDWDRMNYQLLWCFASQFGFVGVKVQKADQNIYYKNPIGWEEEGKERYRKRLMRRYTHLPFELGHINSPDMKTTYRISCQDIKKGYFLADRICSILKNSFRSVGKGMMRPSIEKGDGFFTVLENVYERLFFINLDGSSVAMPNRLMLEDGNPYNVALNKIGVMLQRTGFRVDRLNQDTSIEIYLR